MLGQCGWTQGCTQIGIYISLAKPDWDNADELKVVHIGIYISLAKPDWDNADELKVVTYRIVEQI